MTTNQQPSKAGEEGGRMESAMEGDPVKCGCDEFPECTHALYWYMGFKAGKAEAQPSPRAGSEALRELVAKWRKQANDISEMFPVSQEVQTTGKQAARHADELDAALAGTVDDGAPTNAAYRIWNDLAEFIAFLGPVDNKYKAIAVIQSRIVEMLNREGTALAAATAERTPPQEPKMNNDLIKHMVDRFLCWKLPDDFNPDGGISFKKMRNESTPHPAKNEPVGTNLFDATQAEEMVRFMVEGMPLAEAQSSPRAGTLAQKLQELVDRWMAEAERLHNLTPDERERDSRRSGLLDCMADVITFTAVNDCGAAATAERTPPLSEGFSDIHKNWKGADRQPGWQEAIKAAVYMLQGMQTDAVNQVDRGNVIDRIRSLRPSPAPREKA